MCSFSVSPSVYCLLTLIRFPPVFHEWFLETFPEPSTWLASRLSYGRTAAVMSMVGFILGYDASALHEPSDLTCAQTGRPPSREHPYGYQHRRRRARRLQLLIREGKPCHCQTHYQAHVFEQGLQLETPERVPFRLTQNIVDGMGVTGVEGR
jgi:serine/threonine-protein kinase ATR